MRFGPLAALSLLLACHPSAPEPFHAEAAYRAFRAVAGGTSVGLTKPAYDALLQKASAELLMLKDVAAGPTDSIALVGYTKALAIYVDAGTLWAKHIDDARYDFIPTDSIFYEPGVIEIATTYGLKVTEHRGPPIRGGTFRLIGADAVQELWARAGAASRSADSAIAAHLAKPV